MFLANNFALSVAGNKLSGPLNRGGMPDLPMFRRLLAVCQKSSEPNFFEVTDSFVQLP